jgi:hypothetical protein
MKLYTWTLESEKRNICFTIASFILHVLRSVLICPHSFKASIYMQIHMYGHVQFRIPFSWGEVLWCTVTCGRRKSAAQGSRGGHPNAIFIPRRKRRQSTRRVGRQLLWQRCYAFGLNQTDRRVALRVMQASKFGQTVCTVTRKTCKSSETTQHPSLLFIPTRVRPIIMFQCNAPF